MPTTSDETRRLRLWAAGLLVELLIASGLAFGARWAARGEVPDGAVEIVRALELSGLALGSGAAYTRHPAQADRFAPWAEHPGAFEHLPAGSVLPAGAAGPVIGKAKEDDAP